MSTDIDDLYNEKHIDYGRLNTPDITMFIPPVETKHGIACVDILEHIKNCPVCSKLYNNSNSSQIKEHFKSMDETKKSNTTTTILIVVFSFIVFFIVSYLLIKFFFREKRRSRLSPSFRRS